MSTTFEQLARQALDAEHDLPDIEAVVSEDEYARVLQELSQASVDRNFDAFIDIDWDSPDFQIRDDDPRWVLSADEDPLGAHPWYQAQPLDKQIAMGQWRQANIMKVGLQFENILIRGIMQYVFTRPNGSAEFRYLTHEATEECHHTQMFQEGVNRIGVDVPGMPRWLRRAAKFIPWAASAVPVGFFIGVLAGEEPIDHMQKAVLRSRDEPPRVMQRIMAIHVAEEARHISFAHQYIRRNAPKLGPVDRWLTSLAFPVIMRVLCDAIMIPPEEFAREFAIPDNVMSDIWWRSPQSRRRLADLFGDARMLARDSGLYGPSARVIWKLCKIDGKPSRYRSEPSVTFRT